MAKLLKQALFDITHDVTWPFGGNVTVHEGKKPSIDSDPEDMPSTEEDFEEGKMPAAI